jgi:hypothetical protein
MTRHAFAIALRVTLLALCLLGPSAFAAEVPGETKPGAPQESSAAGAPTASGPTHPLGQPLRLKAFPGKDFYPRYLADPRHPTMRTAVLKVLKSQIPETGDPWIEFTMGGRVRVLQLQQAGDDEHGLQFSLEAAFIGVFDPDNHYDDIGWDGVYAVRFSYKPFDWLSLKLADQHDSAHIGDEYMRRTGRKRLTYTREEVALGALVSFPFPVRAYAETGYAWHLGDDTMRRWRAQAGVEAELGFAYAAVDTTYWQELEWAPTLSSQLGVKFEAPELGRRYGVAAQGVVGRAVLGEFYRDQVRTVGGVVWVDL